MPEKTFDPYAPPQYVAEPDFAGQLDARIEGGYLVLNKQALIPDVCLKCGTHEGIVRRSQNFSYTPPWVFAVLIVCNLGGLFAMLLATKKTKLNLPLCARCNARWKSAKIAVGLSAMLLVSPLLVLFVGIEGSAASSLLLMLLAIGCLAFIVVMTVYVKPRTLKARSIDEMTIKLAGVEPTAALYVARTATR